MFKSIINKSIDEIKNEIFDFAIFSCGVEDRCHTSFTNIINFVTTKTFVFEFSNSIAKPSHIANRQVFQLRRVDLNVDFIIINNDEDVKLLGILKKAIENINSREVKIYLDYCSMPRKWYHAILTLLNEYIQKTIKLTINYTAYEYSNENFPTIDVGVLKAANMHYGNIMPNKPKLLLLGLGFDKYGAKALLEKVEARYVVFYTNPAYLPSQTENIQKMNYDILHSSDSIFEIPICDLEKSFALIESAFINHRKEYSVIIASLGPKPMVMLSNIVCLKYPEITNLQISSIYHFRNHEDQNVLMNFYPAELLFKKQQRYSI
jgi:hypothetical protein